MRCGKHRTHLHASGVGTIICILNPDIQGTTRHRHVMTRRIPINEYIPGYLYIYIIYTEHTSRRPMCVCTQSVASDPRHCSTSCRSLSERYLTRSQPTRNNNEPPSVSPAAYTYNIMYTYARIDKCRSQNARR